MQLITGRNAINNITKGTLLDFFRIIDNSKCYFYTCNNEIVTKFNELIEFNAALIDEWLAIPIKQYNKDLDCIVKYHIYHQDNFDKTIPIHKSKYYLSFNGNILVKRENQSPFWCNAKGDFLQNANKWEIENVKTEITIPLTTNSLELLSAINKLKAEEWYHVASIRSCDDFSSFKAETCNNGGDYAFYTTTHLFVSTVGRKAQLETTSTSADISFDELKAQFQSNCRSEQLIDVVNDFCVYTSEEDVYLSENCLLIQDFFVSYKKINENDSDDEDISYELSDDKILDIIKQHKDYEMFNKYLSLKPRTRGKRRN